MDNVQPQPTRPSRTPSGRGAYCIPPQACRPLVRTRHTPSPPIGHRGETTTGRHGPWHPEVEVRRPNPRNANGHRRRQLRTRVLAEEDRCALCGRPVDKTLAMHPGMHGPRCQGGDCPGCVPHPARPEVDEDVPISRGGSPYDRANTALMHRACNQWKSNRTLDEARAALTAGTKATQPRTAPVAHSNTW